ncbi:hypothetical protein HYPSUDRAFT_66618 [Hypholoma sublateritium FD-334 SS-4]|uniref:Uncharacterized protein n=1 Tax=Hypholoma sublateritium (strain FD-334 SS-4) TaxID=945553 RepID=A0A0D2NWL1_HYPSF|nr:hypothetical protein HYPSUDRAFT_66618 [Hypholoma sublateritium FD-334 SS-4]
MPGGNRSRQHRVLSLALLAGCLCATLSKAMHFQPHADTGHGTRFATSLFFSYLGSTHGITVLNLLCWSFRISHPFPFPSSSHVSRLSPYVPRYLLAFVVHLILLLGYWELAYSFTYPSDRERSSIIHSRARGIFIDLNT